MSTASSAETAWRLLVCLLELVRRDNPSGSSRRRVLYPSCSQYGVAAAREMSPPRRSGCCQEEIDGGSLAVRDDYEIGAGVSRRLARAARHSPDPTAIAYRLRRGERLIFEVRMSSLDHACDAVDLVTAAVSTVMFVEHSVFVDDFIDRCAPPAGVDLTEHVVEIAKQ